MQRLSEGNPYQSKAVPGEEYKKRAWGFAAAYKNTGLGGGAPDHAEQLFELFPNGKFEVRTSSADLGQGLVTVSPIDCFRRTSAACRAGSGASI